MALGSMKLTKESTKYGVTTAGCIFVSVVVAIILGLTGCFILRDGEIPQIPDQYWGPGDPTASAEDSSIRPFPINISETILSDLKARLSLEVATHDSRILNTLEGIGFQYGMNTNFLKNLTTYWLNKYDWKQREILLNKYPHYKTKISGIDIHFQHVKPKTKGKNWSRPLLILHGWPFSIAVFQKIIPLLVDAEDSDINFELIIPSLPGFGFSESASKPGLGSPEMAVIFFKLMQRLGHVKFYIQGSDWGHTIASNMAVLYKESILGLHSTMCFTLHPKVILRFGLAAMMPRLFLDEDEIIQHIPIQRTISTLLRESGYFHFQATKPDTIGIGLAHSPSGLAAYIIEKYSFITNRSWLDKEDGGLTAHFDFDELLDNVMILWFGNSHMGGLRLYKETAFNFFESTQWAFERVPIEVPFNCLNLPEEPLAMPKFPLLAKYPKLRYTKHTTGGHVNMVEIPEIVAKDVIEAVKCMEKDAMDGLAV